MIAVYIEQFYKKTLFLIPDDRRALEIILS